MEEHDARLRLVLTRCQQSGIRLKPSKCVFRSTSVKYFGHVLSGEGVSADTDKLKAVAEMPRPKNREELHRFLGMIAYLAKFVPHHSQISAPLHALQLQVDNCSYEALKLSCTLRDQARLNTISEPHAGAWLRAVPNPNLGLAMSRHEFSIAVRLWLGITLFPAHPSAVRCKCGQLMDGFGDHLLGCRQIHFTVKTPRRSQRRHFQCFVGG